MPKDRIIDIFKESLSVISASKDLMPEIHRSVDAIVNCFEKGNKLIVFGNGGSAADAQHFAAEFIGRFKTERQSLPAIAITTDTSILTSLGNDYGFQYVFSRQCESLVKKDDVVLAISTSGKSENVLKGMSISKKKGAFVIGLTGKNKDKFKKNTDILLSIPSTSTPRIQEAHRIILHIVCEIVEEYFTKN